ncbi:MAG TPA: hypothetical protein VGG48_01875 [Rhizomicrobium sp.]|jgi:hypothetical protein
MLRFLDGFLLGTTSSAGAAAADSGAGGGAANNNAFLGTLPEPLRAHPAFKEVSDVGSLAQRYADTQKPFAEQLPEAIRGEAYFKDIKSFPDLATKAFNQAKMIGKNPDTLVELPANDDAKAWESVYAKLGRPEAADKYEIPKLADGKDYTPADRDFQNAVLPILHKAGVTQRQFAAIMPEWNALQQQVGAAAETARVNEIKAGHANLDKEWGAAKGEKLKLAQSTINFLASDEKGPKLGGDLAAALEQTDPSTGQKLGTHPAFARLFAYLGAQMQEDGLIGKGGGGGQGDALSPAEAQQHINARQADTKFMAAYQNKRAPDHADAVKEMQRLYELAYPAQKQG